MLRLLSEKPFAQGGNRLCFIHPEDPCLCVKVRRPDFTLEDLRRKKGFPKSLRPLSSFDDNLEEYRVMCRFKKTYDDVIYRHVSRCYGFVETDLGKGLVSELIRDEGQKISQTLKKYIWDHGQDDKIMAAAKDLADFWLQFRVPSRDLLLHNIVVQMEAQRIVRLVVIDGLGSSGLVPFSCLPASMQSAKVERKVKNFYTRIDKLAAQRQGAEQLKFPGYHGQLIHDGSECQKK